jgi:hypothetical protein
MNACLVSGGSGEGEDHDNFVIARSHRHADAVVFAALVLAHERVRLGIEEIRVWIERMQHAGNGPVVDSLIRIHWLGVIVFDDGVNVGELLQAIFDIGIARRRRRLSTTLGEKNTEKATRQQEENYQEE